LNPTNLDLKTKEHRTPRGTGFDYAQFRVLAANLLGESQGSRPVKPMRELEVQGRLFHGDLGNQWTTLCGKKITMLDPGRWNREPGPDFLEAVFEWEDGTRIRGDVEVDSEVLDWERHGHSVNPAFENVVMHFVLRRGSFETFTRTKRNRQVPQILLDPAGKSSGPVVPFELLEHPVRDVNRAMHAISLANEFRQKNKAERLKITMALHGKRGALFQALAAGLGYKSNSLPLLLLAERTGTGKAAAEQGEALVFGLAGFLDVMKFEAADLSGRDYQRGLWETWWKIRHEQERLILPADLWKTAAVRPYNHPHRRAACLPLIARKIDALLSCLRRMDAKGFCDHLISLQHPYWSHHFTLTSAESTAALSMVGSQRISDLLTNVFWPWACCLEDAPAGEFLKLRAGSIPAKVRDAAFWFCPELTRKALGFAWVQQGLLQLDADFRGCKTPREICEHLLPGSPLGS